MNNNHKDESYFVAITDWHRVQMYHGMSFSQVDDGDEAPKIMVALQSGGALRIYSVDVYEPSPRRPGTMHYVCDADPGTMISMGLCSPALTGATTYILGPKAIYDGAVFKVGRCKYTVFLNRKCRSTPQAYRLYRQHRASGKWVPAKLASLSRVHGEKTLLRWLRNCNAKPVLRAEVGGA